jgi:rhodanese-related sulfurtransferase
VKASVARQALLLVVLAFLPAIGQAIYFRDKVSWQSRVAASEMVSVAQARGWGEKAIWVDARPDDEFVQEHVPGAISLNEDRWDELLPQFLATWSQLPVSPEEKYVVVYCSAQNCNLAGDVARRLRNQTNPPMQNVYVLDGGWEEWLKEKK